MAGAGEHRVLDFIVTHFQRHVQLVIIFISLVSRKRVLSAAIQLVAVTYSPEDLFEVAVSPHDIERLDKLVSATDIRG